MNIIEQILAIVILILLSPLLLVISLSIYFIDGYFPFFTATRIGKGSTPFVCIKFQTLKPTNNEADYMDAKKDQLRITKFGRFLRNRGWDELPQLINIAKGEMSFIGPRPVPNSEYKALMSKYPEQHDLIHIWKISRLKAKPGLSGWHQIHLTDHNIVKYDLEYLNHSSLSKKLQIANKSLAILLFGKNYIFQTTIPDTYIYELDKKGRNHTSPTKT